MIITKSLILKSPNPAPKLLDITPRVQRVVQKSNIKDGTVLVFSRHTTAAIILQEKEKNLKRDLRRIIGSFAPKEAEYHHSKAPDHLVDGLPNGHSHCQHLMLGSSEIIPLANGELLLGTYQKIFLVELDRTRMREVVVQVNGE